MSDDSQIISLADIVEVAEATNEHQANLYLNAGYELLGMKSESEFFRPDKQGRNAPVTGFVKRSWMYVLGRKPGVASVEKAKLVIEASKLRKDFFREITAKKEKQGASEGTESAKKT